MLYSIALKKTAGKDLDRINDPYFNAIINEIENLSILPRNDKVKKLTGKDDEYRLRVGDYRVLFYINDEEQTLKIARVLHRKEAYKK